MIDIKMKYIMNLLWISQTSILIVWAIAGSAQNQPEIKIENAKTQFFAQEVEPILRKNCVSCHGGEKPASGLNLTSREGVMKGGVNGAVVFLDKPETGRLLDAINYRKGLQMPPSGKIAQKDIDTLTKWVKSGIPFAAMKKMEAAENKHIVPPKVTPETMNFWSFQPVKQALVPSVKAKGWVRTPVDAFVLKKLETAGLAPNSPAGKTALMRRVYYDLIGLPPSPAEIQAFLDDKSPKAYEVVVDKLLASPQYGVKWGRHWLDLVHYAETNSYERDGPKPNAWRYRDYVINSFNQDKPYNQFVMEQLAGDELDARTPERMIATGYYRMGIWDDEPADHDQALYDDLDDIASTTGQVFLGLTVGCARCHDHKIDPIPQKDYYSFLSFFSGVERFSPNAQRSIAPETVQEKERIAAAVHQEKLAANRRLIIVIEKPVLADLSPVEKEEFRNEQSHRDIVRKRVPKLVSQQDYDHYLVLRDELRSLMRFQPRSMEMALAVNELGPEPRPTSILLRGNPHVFGDPVQPAFLSVLAPPKPEIILPKYGDTSGRRLALAKWVASRDNPLAARVMANRIWQYHFGRGIVRTPNNFGFQGLKPTHLELLDWLASELVKNDWKLKPLHRMILLSSTYRMSSQANPVALKKDTENDLFWRFDMRRLEAEEVRDSILAVNGSLNLQMGGPSVYTTIPAAVLAGQSRPGDGWGHSTPDQENRRSAYIYVKRSLITPIVASFDGPETDFTCPVRFATTQPTQALGMLNSAFIKEQARAFANDAMKSAGEKPADCVKLCLWRTLQREPSPSEIERGVKLISSLQQRDKMSRQEALAYFCVIALNLNEFMYLD